MAPAPQWPLELCLPHTPADQGPAPAPTVRLALSGRLVVGRGSQLAVASEVGFSEEFVGSLGNTLACASTLRLCFQLGSST